jgi:hypothetical protein
LLKLGSKLYVADTNNQAIRVIDLEKREVSTLSVHEASSATPSAGQRLSESLPNVKKAPLARVAASGDHAVVDLEKGWKLNAQAPSYLALFEGAKHLVSFDREQLHAGPVALPKLAAGHRYRLQGTLYFCEAKEGSVCLIQSFDQELEAASGGVTEIRIPLRGPGASP